MLILNGQDGKKIDLAALDRATMVIAESEQKFAEYCDGDGAFDIPLNALLATATKD
jgi:hypothetical protein